MSSNVRLLSPHLIIERASGCRMWDADGTEYLDYLLGQGPNFLGHAPPRVMEKVLAAQRDGITFAATHPKEIEAAERVLAALGWAETMRFGSSSSEMVQAAVRIARAVTGRRCVLRFEGQYHGWLDNIYAQREGTAAGPASQGQLASALSDVLMIEWNDAAAFERAVAERGDEIAAVIMEPVMLNAGAIVPGPGYLQAVREACLALADAREMARTWRSATGQRALLLPVPLPGQLGRALRRGVLISQRPDVTGTIRFADWLASPVAVSR